MMTPDDIPRIYIDVRMTAPPWARLQREVVRRLEQAAPEFVARYTRPDGTLVWRSEWPGMDGSDDPYEAFMYLALFYALGGSERVYELARRMWEAITWQWTQYGQLNREFDRYYDWMHHGEANLFHYFFGLTKPESLIDRQRADRFARMYTGEDPLAPNYDSDLRIIRASQTGSDGPRFVVTAEDLGTHRGVLELYPPPFEDIPGVAFPSDTTPWRDDEVFGRIIGLMNERTTRGDVPVNLNATGQVTHAYLYSGDRRLREWVVSYLAAWKQRADDNGGIVPDNVGLSGLVGEYLGGRWWGGHYGWRWPHGYVTIIEPIINAGVNALLLTGEEQQLALARQQLDAHFQLGRRVDGRWVTPHKHVDSGWTDYRPAEPFPAIQVWARTHASEDLDRVLRVPRLFDWSEVRVPRRPLSTKHYNVNTLSWFEFIRGEAAHFPEAVLRANLEVIDQQLARLRSEQGDPRTWDRLEFIDGFPETVSLAVDGNAIHAWQEFCPVYFEGLLVTMSGAPMHMSHGGLQHMELRYYDAQLRRPGLPHAVAALVSEVTATTVVVDLVNLDEVAPRRVVLQAGAFREHRFDAVTVAGERTVINGGWLEVELAPGCGSRLKFDTARYVYDPSYETPWSRRPEWPPLITGRSVA